MGVFYITTPIYYPNAPPHIGHAYTTVFADVMARYHRLLGDDTFFLTGTDEHGLKLQKAAEKLGKKPKELVDEMAEKYKEYWSLLDISYDRFIRTTDPDHEEVVRRALEKLYKKNLIYRSKYSGYYCVDCEKFYSPGEYEVIDGRPYCPIHKKPLEWVEEETYYFRLSEFEEFVREALKKDIVYPEAYAKEVLGKLEKEGLRDVSIARPKDRVSWGIPLPFDERYTTYVWFDALLNYVSGIGWLKDPKTFEKYWNNVHHVIGKDILWFHTVIWFSMLKALDIPLPKRLIVHAFLINKGLKIGKSSGNIIAIEDLVERYQSSDGVRYILMRVFNLSKDVEITTSLLDSIYNTELADTYGNLIRRVGVLAIKKLNDVVERRNIKENRLLDLASETIDNYLKFMDSFDVSRSLESIMNLLREANAYINIERPWEKIDPTKDIYVLLESIRIATNLLLPVIPRTASKVSKALGFDFTKLTNLNILSIDTYNVKEAPILFKKIKI
jgi:methionyl-tRNA synthetase